ncbi:hypothetical protein BN14_00712 [Rhizoctonia solani AG-1 IB]|uniref:Uncharacterized protein n=1 Tax=Thanatephorus cucumeris (strain AG1-IB / isolate 7/3/14) TaxID=1108050 RepID=M5BJ84_THACB|nr:hypothetical protein BN14_00712 [Rhizoctonia solani AG-1 IB]
MNNPRRFTPGTSRPSAPTTPRSANKVLPTPPTSAIPVFRVPDDSAEGANTTSRPETGSMASAQPGVRPKLPIEGFAKNRRIQPDGNVRGANSPARPSRVPVHSTTNADYSARPQRIFGQSNGLLPSLSPPPLSPALLTRSIHQGFPRPFSPPEDQDNARNLDINQENELDPLGTHTSASGALDSTPVYQRAPQAHSSSRQASIRRQNTPIMSFQEDFDESGMESPSPSKRPATGDHGDQAPNKRMRSVLDHSHDQNLHGDRYLSQEQPLSTAPHASQVSLPHGYYSTTLEAYIEAHQSEWIAAQKRWETCTMEEWQNGPKGTYHPKCMRSRLLPGPTMTELAAELDKVMSMVKTFMAKRMEVYAGINNDVQVHKARLDGRDTQLGKEKERLIKQAGGLAGGFIPS